MSACPSELTLDAYELDELRDPPLMAHIRRCPECQGRLEARRSEFSAMPGRDAMLASLHVQLAEPGPLRRPGWRIWGGMLVAAAAAVLFVVRPEAPALRSKGAMGLSIYVEREGEVVQASSGEVFHPGERLRFEVDLSRSAEIMILGREASGAVYGAFPIGEGVLRSRPMQGGADQVLPGAVQLDASVGREVLYLVGCERAFDSSQLDLGAVPPRAPEGCGLSRFVLDKAGP